MNKVKKILTLLFAGVSMTLGVAASSVSAIKDTNDAVTRNVFEADADGIALQFSRCEAHNRVLIADARIIQIDGLRAVIDGQLVKAFRVGAGAVGRIDDADVHVLHAKVTVNGSFGLGEEGGGKQSDKQG